MTIDLREVTGFRGEKIVELALTNYEAFQRPLFRPGFLGDKWPTVDFYVELTDVPGRRPYFFVQAKSTAAPLPSHALNLAIRTKQRDVERLLRLPGPTYIFAVHEPSHRVFVRSIHTGTARKAITSIPLTHELTTANLRKLHDEVNGFWGSIAHKPTASEFA